MDDYIGMIGGAEDAFAGAMGGTFLAVFLIIYFVGIFLSLAFSIACYVLHSLGLYTIAGRRGLRHKWLAWLPVGNAWLLGSISDQYQYLVKGKVKHCRRWLLFLNIVVLAIYFGSLGSTIGAMLFSDYAAAAIIQALGGWLVLIAVLMVFGVLRWMAYYNLFRSCQPSNAILYLLLSIFVPVTQPFFVFFARKKDLGMPPRKQPPVAPVAEEIVEETVEEIPEEPEEETTE